jgi:D-xylose 1-dehydrogenase (NADP+, D-xylono-1,5-lactone-forming)
MRRCSRIRRSTPSTCRCRTEGTLGRLLAVRSTFTFPLASLEDVRAQPELAGGALMDVGCYCVNGSRLVAGEPESVLAEQVTGPTGIDMAFFGTMRFPGDVVGQFEASFLAPQRQSLEVVGEDAVLVALAPWRTDWPGNVSVVRGDRTDVLEVSRGNAYTFELANMAAAIAGDASALLGRDDALGQARTIEALYRSAASGAAVSVS